MEIRKGWWKKAKSSHRGLPVIDDVVSSKCLGVVAGDEDQYEF